MNAHQRILCELIRESPKPHGAAIEVLSDAAFSSLATQTKMHGMISHAVPQAPEAWRNFHDANLKKIGKMITTLETITAESQLTAILLENGAVARAWSCLGCFSFGDLDVLVRIQDSPAIDRALRSREFTGIQDRGRIVYRSAEATFNIQTRLVTGVFSKFLRGPDFDELCANSTGSGLLRLAPEYLLMQLCMHAMSHFLIASPGIALYRDICWHLKRADVDWQMFAGLCKRFRVERQVRQVLSIAHLVLSIDAPEVYCSAPLVVDPDSLFSLSNLSAAAKLTILRKLYFEAR